MYRRLKSSISGRNFGLKSMTTAALGSLLAGLVLASGLNLTGPLNAQDFPPIIGSASGSPVIENSFAPIAERLAPSVVNIKVTKVRKAGHEMRGMPDGPFGEYFGRFFGEGGGFGEARPMEGAGSGVIISDEGYILTNNHVVEGAREVLVTLADKREAKAEIVGRDPGTDLAVLRITGEKNLPAARMGDSSVLKVGDWVLAIGNPFGLGHTLTSGIVSAKGRVIGAGPYDNFIQTDASINPGNSGGPLFNMKGEVIGINTAINAAGQGIGFAIPIDTAKPLIPQLIKDGGVTRGYIGVNIQPLTPEIVKALELEDSRGALISDVVPGGPAEKAGIKSGDVIISFNGKTVKDSQSLPTLVAATPVGEKATVTVLRDGREKNLRLEVSKLRTGADRAESREQPARGKWGLSLRNIDPRATQRFGLDADQAVVIAGVTPGSPADKAAMQRGDIILEVNRKPVKSVEEVEEKVAEAKGKDVLLLLVQRNGTKLHVALKG